MLGPSLGSKQRQRVCSKVVLCSERLTAYNIADTFSESDYYFTAPHGPDPEHIPVFVKNKKVFTNVRCNRRDEKCSDIGC